MIVRQTYGPATQLQTPLPLNSKHSKTAWQALPRTAGCGRYHDCFRQGRTSEAESWQRDERAKRRCCVGGAFRLSDACLPRHGAGGDPSTPWAARVQSMSALTGAATGRPIPASQSGSTEARAGTPRFYGAAATNARRSRRGAAQVFRTAFSTSRRTSR